MMRALQRESGMVLLLVLVIIALLSSMVAEFAFSTLVDMRLTETFRDRTRAYYLAKGGVTVGRMVLQKDTNSFDAPGDPRELWSQGLPGYPVGGGVLSVEIEDLGGKLDVNRLVTAQDNPDAQFKQRFLLLFENLGLTNPGELTDALIDWIDTNDKPEPLGAENPYYLDQDPSYPCGDGPLNSLDELSRVRGFTTEVVEQVRPHLTAYGSAKINVNSASAEVLMAMSEDPVIDRQAAEDIIALREEAPFESAADLKELNRIPGLENLLRSPFDISSSTYRIRTRAEVNDGIRRVEAIVDKANNRLLYLKVS